MYNRVGACIAVEGYVQLWRGMYGCGGLCIAVEGYEQLCMTIFKQ